MTDLDEVKTMLTAVINGQSSMKAELISKIESLEKKLATRIVNLETKTDKGFKEVNHRIDLLGKQLNALDDDAPTGEDFKNLVDRVTKLENKNFISA